MDTIIQTLARELGRTEEHVKNVVTLIDEGATIPFIARYRKELHGSMDDQMLRQLADRLQYLRNLDARKAEIKGAIDSQGKLTDELAAAIDGAATLAEAEDLYRPYKQKRRTRATVAREKGLEPLADLLFAQERDCPDPCLLYTSLRHKFVFLIGIHHLSDLNFLQHRIPPFSAVPSSVPCPAGAGSWR